tara:strand:+ start:755 stop:2206 length:1452 start_codon:yes stop_codon:yes gene_type:complete
MIENYEIQDINDMAADERLPIGVIKWTNTFAEVSRYNEYPAILAYFCLLGQIIKDNCIIPYGFTKEDTRFHVGWIQTARSGKSVLNDFLTQVSLKTFDYINSQMGRPESDPYFTMFDVVDYTDAALIGSVKTVKNEHYGEEGHPQSDEKEVEKQVYGALEGTGLAVFDEFESSGIFKRSAHKENVVTYFQKFMNTLTTDGYKIKKKLAHGPELICDCQRSVWATTYVPEHLTDVIATKGVLQRMFLYVRDVPQHVLDDMRRELIRSLGTTKARLKPTNDFAKHMLELWDCTVKRYNELDGDKEKIVSFADGCHDLMELEYSNMVRYLAKVPDEVRKVVSLFETNSLIYIAKLAVLCTIAETPNRREEERWVVFPRNIRQASWIVRQGYMSLVGWMITSLKVQRTSVAEQINVSDYIEAFNTMDKIEGYVNKAELRVYMEQRYHVPQARFYRVWPKISHKFETKKAGKTILIKLKEENENESNL